MTYEQELWEEIEEFPGYAVSSLGSVVNLKRGFELTCRPNQYGILRVGLVKDRVQHTRAVAPLVAEAFVDRPEPHWDTPIHLDGDHWNCRAINLMWRPRSYAIMFHKQFMLDTFHTSYILKLIDIATEEIYESVKEVCMRNGLYWYHVVKSYVEHTFTPLTFQEFLRLEEYMNTQAS